jgi:hypothetical protein
MRNAITARAARRVLAALSLALTAHPASAAVTLVVGRDSSPTTTSEVRTFFANGQTVTQQPGSLQPFGASFRGGVRVAIGDVNHNGTSEIIAATGADPATNSNLNTFDATPGATNYALFPYTNFHGGLYIATGNVNNNGFDDIVIGPGAGAGTGPLVRVWDGGTTSYIHAFNAFDPSFTGGVRVAAGDVTGDGRADIVAGTGAGVPANVRVFNAVSLATERNFFPFGPSFTGGVFVASGDVSGDGRADIIASQDEGGAPLVRVFDGVTLEQLFSFNAFAAGFTGGVRVAAGDVNGDGRADIIAGAGPGGAPEVRIFSGADLNVLGDFFAFEPGFTGGVFVAAAQVPEPTAIASLPLLSLAIIARRRHRTN